MVIFLLEECPVFSEVITGLDTSISSNFKYFLASVGNPLRSLLFMIWESSIKKTHPEGSYETELALARVVGLTTAKGG
jgi:hypothetical protein